MNNTEIKAIAQKCAWMINDAPLHHIDHIFSCIEQAILEATQPLQQRIAQLEKQFEPLDFHKEVASKAATWYINHAKWSSFQDHPALKAQFLGFILEATQPLQQRVEQLGLESERAQLKLIDERDAAEQSLSHAYFLVTGRSPQWSNNFGHQEALNEIDEAQTVLRLETAREKCSVCGKLKSPSMIEAGCCVFCIAEQFRKERDSLRLKVEKLEKWLADELGIEKGEPNAGDDPTKQYWVGADQQCYESLAEAIEAAISTTTKEEGK